MKTVSKSKPTRDASTLPYIKKYFEKKADWVKAQEEKEKKTGVPLQTTLHEIMLKELEKTVDGEEDAYAEALQSRTPEQKHEAITKIIAIRREAAAQVDEDSEEVTDEAPREPRKKGYLERKFDALCSFYEAHPSDKAREELIALITQMEVNRRVRFFYDLQKLRVASTNRKDTYYREFGIHDPFLDYTGSILERLESQNERMVQKILLRSPDRDFFLYLNDFVGVGTMMSACLISECSAPERFHSVSSLWSYAGLAVRGHDPVTGRGGRSQRKERGQKAEWNHFLRTKLLGVLAPCIIKAQTRYITGEEVDLHKGRNVKVLHDYKLRLVTQNESLSEKERYYDSRGREIFQYYSDKPIEVFRADGEANGQIAPKAIPRRRKKHLHLMAQRYMVKMWLVEVLNEWRKFRGYQPLLTYHESVLRGGIAHKALDVRRLPGYDPELGVQQLLNQH